jgi:hypothetical protein
MQESSFDIFSGTPERALWLATVKGLSNAQKRMREIATGSPGRYFIFSTERNTPIDQIETLGEAAGTTDVDRTSPGASKSL